ncbi:hypothetical protein H257_08731 [Aphanomyces astaci]|uniref:Oxidation resistance protein 1 n=2 Tax=Aphanomyces astaci TaxID=112090 RepID=W4GC70_APHAT|nr:hypothetical protein H257_08731 [Aphanomyces astaci]ETV77282.1 hypothetical protein H257_08731 [Aphanomyces astaci]|eukprot:XP_009833069.1 hypothetical protein H257_08731 [Aphanomyces astaci]
MVLLAEPSGVFSPLPSPYSAVATECRLGVPTAHRAAVYLYLCCESDVKPTFIEASYTAAMSQVFKSGVPTTLTRHASYFGGLVHLAPYDLTPIQVQGFHHVCILFQHLGGVSYCPYLVHLIPLLLSQTSEAATFVAVSNLLKPHQQPGPHHAYRKLPTSVIADTTLARFFKEILQWRYTEVATALTTCQGDDDSYFIHLFHRFFVGFFPMPVVYRVLDSYLADGPKVLCRVLLAVFKLTRHEMVKCTATGEAWWAQLQAVVNGPSFDFDAMFTAAFRSWYGYLFKKANLQTMHKALEKRKSVRLQSAKHQHAHVHHHLPLLISPKSSGGRLLDPHRDAAVTSWLPLGLQMKHFRLLYNAEVHGRGLDRLYSHCERGAASPEMLLLVEELTTGSVVGVFVSHQLGVHQSFFGDHRCFPFALVPTPHAFKQLVTSPAHHHAKPVLLKYMLCLPTMMAFGVSSTSSAAALELDEDLMRGKSDESDLFQSPPLVGGGVVEFDVGGVEVYDFTLE